MRWLRAESLDHCRKQVSMQPGKAFLPLMIERAGKKVPEGRAASGLATGAQFSPRKAAGGILLATCLGE